MTQVPYLCRFLRWKNAYAQHSFTPEDLAREASNNEVPCQCMETFQPFGPDDLPACIDGCGPQRPCYQRSPKLIDPPRAMA